MEWSRTADLLSALERIGRQGSVVVVKIDGQRAENLYTVILSGGPLGERTFRKDSSDLSTTPASGLRS